MDRELLERLRDMAYETGWVAGQAEAGIKQDEAYQKAKIAARNQVMETIAAQHEQEVAAVRKHTWAEAEAHFAPYVAADDAAFRLFEQYSEGGGLTPAETLEKVAEVMDGLSYSLAEQIDRAVAAEEEAQGLQAQVAMMAGAITDVLERRGRGDSWLGETLRAALSAAPKVLMVTAGRWREDPSLPGRVDLLVNTPTTVGDKRVVIGLTTAPVLPDKGQQVNVFVVECPPEGEQGYKRARGVVSLGGKRPEDVIAEMRGRPTESEQRSRHHEQSQKSEQGKEETEDE